LLLNFKKLIIFQIVYSLEEKILCGETFKEPKNFIHKQTIMIFALELMFSLKITKNFALKEKVVGIS
jgi:hypothetical protein